MVAIPKELVLKEHTYPFVFIQENYHSYKEVEECVLRAYKSYSSTKDFPTLGEIIQESGLEWECLLAEYAMETNEIIGDWGTYLRDDIIASIEYGESEDMYDYIYKSMVGGQTYDMQWEGDNPFLQDIKHILNKHNLFYFDVPHNYHDVLGDKQWMKPEEIEPLLSPVNPIIVEVW